MPLAVVGSNVVVEVNGKKVRGRQYPWGVAEGMSVSVLHRRKEATFVTAVSFAAQGRRRVTTTVCRNVFSAELCSVCQRTYMEHKGLKG